mgnify:CR=1 FL=1
MKKINIDGESLYNYFIKEVLYMFNLENYKKMVKNIMNGNMKLPF